MTAGLITQPPWRLFRISAAHILPPSCYAVDSAIDGYDVAFLANGQAEEEVKANGRLIAAAPALRDACEAVLLFHSGGPWDETKREQWFNLTQETDATTKVLCDTVRKALAGTTKED